MGESDEIRMIEQEMSSISDAHGKEVALDRYRGLQNRLAEIYSERAKTCAPPTLPDATISKEETQFRESIRKVGMGMPKDLQMDQWGLISPQKMFEGTRKWHLAAAKVFEYCEAQLNMDLFKDDLEATQIFKQLIVKGFQQLHNEANGGHR